MYLAQNNNESQHIKID